MGSLLIHAFAPITHVFPFLCPIGLGLSPRLPTPSTAWPLSHFGFVSSSLGLTHIMP